MKRAEFLRSLGLTSSTLMAVYCLGTVTACSSETPNPINNGNGNSNGNNSTIAGVTGTTSGAAINFTVDLANANVKDLVTASVGFIIVGELIVARRKSGDYIALSKACTHQGTTVQYRNDTDDIWCSNHGSVFSTSGAVVNGPAASPLKMYTTTLDTAKNTLTVKA
jgi:cytochrome b6-f complex iron-sulfur subunit